MYNKIVKWFTEFTVHTERAKEDTRFEYEAYDKNKDEQRDAAKYRVDTAERIHPQFIRSASRGSE